MGGSCSAQNGAAQMSKEDEEEKQKLMQQRGKRRSSISAECETEEDTPYEKKVIAKTPETITRIEAAVADNFLFASLDAAQKKEIIDAMDERKVEKVGEVIIKQGDEGDFFYVIESGEFDVTLEGQSSPVLQYKNGGAFGELALMYNWPRASTVTATKEGILWALDRSTFKHVIVDANRKKAKMYEEFLSNHDILKNLDPKERATIADNFLPLEFAPGKDVVTQGEDDKSSMKFYIVIDGELKAIRDGVEVNKHGPGSYFGEKALIEDVPRAATIQAVTNCKLVAMDVAAFIRLMGPCQDVMKRNIQEYKTAEQAQADAKTA